MRKETQMNSKQMTGPALEVDTNGNEWEEAWIDLGGGVMLLAFAVRVIWRLAASTL